MTTERETTMSDMTLWGFDNSTYVRTVKMLLAEKGFTDFKQVPLNVLAGEPRTPAHLERHPFGKVPVLDHDGMRILETSAIARYLNDVLPGKYFVYAIVNFPPLVGSSKVEVAEGQELVDNVALRLLAK